MVFVQEHLPRIRTARVLAFLKEITHSKSSTIDSLEIASMISVVKTIGIPIVKVLRRKCGSQTSATLNQGNVGR